MRVMKLLLTHLSGFQSRYLNFLDKSNKRAKLIILGCLRAGDIAFLERSKMNILIAGGSGFIGTALGNLLRQNHHDVFILTRQPPKNVSQIQWDGRTSQGWGSRVGEMDAVVNVTGFGLEHWPWTMRQKQKFDESRILPGRALVSAIKTAKRRPRIFLQNSGINHYGLRGTGLAEESTPAASDYLAQRTVEWESASQPVEEMGIRRLVTRSAVILARNGGLFPLMALPVRLCFGGKLGDGTQAMPWIHLTDQIRAMKFLLENENCHGAYNLVAPTQTSNAEFMRAIARTLHRPFWFHVPKTILSLVLGEMSVLLAEGRYSQPKRLLDEGYIFEFPSINKALENMYPN